MPRCFLPPFLALSDTDDEAIDDEASEGDDEASEDVNDDGTAETLRDRRARVLRRDFRFFFCSGRCLT